MNRTATLFFTCITFIFFCVRATAQIKVGDNPDVIKSASLIELESTNKGFVFPRVSLTGTVTSPAPLAADILAGTVVYNTNAAFTGGIGLCMWTGSAWMAVTPSSLSSTDAWKLTGNSGTNPSTNFIGTTDAQPLIFKVNGQKAGYLNSSGSATSTSFGYQSLNVNTGNDNTAMGYYSMLINTTGNGNTALGVSSLRSNTTGSSNTGIGWNTLFNSTGNNNTALGSNALFLNTTGTNNIAIGNSADVTSGNLTNATAIGYNAKVAISNAMVLGNGVNVGIGNSSPTAALHVTGTVRFENLTNGVLTADATGNLSIKSLASINGNSWSTTGNGGTTPGTNFIGTTDGQPLIFKVNGVNAGKIDFTSSANTSFGFKTLNVNSSGQDNVANGAFALSANTTGSYNVAVGTAALISNTTGTNNVANGYAALYANTAGSDNVAAGFQSLTYNKTGSYNISIGRNSLSNNIDGSNNTAIGNQADVSSGNLTNATAIGYNAKAAISNSVILGNATDGVNVGIGTSTPSQKLEVNGGSIYANGQSTGFLTDFGINASVGLIKYAGHGGGVWRTNKQQFEIGRVDASVTSLPGTPASFTTDLYVSGTGQVGVGTTGTTALLDVNGSTRLRGLTTAGIVTTDANGNLNSTATSGLVTASNGLTKAGSDIQLGGSLTKNTTIDAGATNFFAVTSNALDAPTLDQQNTTGPLIINQYSTQWQSFTCRKDGVLSRVDLGLFAYPYGIGTYNYTVDIYTGTGLGGTLIGTATVSYVTTSAGGFSLSVPFSAKPALLWGGVYTIHLSSTNPGTGWFAGDDSYSGGVASVMYANYDYIFTTYMQGTLTSSGLIVKNGFVGVSASDPQHPLTIQANTGGTMLGFYNSSGTDKYNFSLTSGGLNLSESNVGGARIFVKDGGNVGIGTNTPGYKLDVNGGIRCVGAVVTTSDARLKKDVQPINSALSGVLALRGVRYTFRRSEFPAMGLPAGQQIGLLAQEVEKIYPELVSTDAQGYKAVNYAQLAPVLIEAIKEQQEEIDSNIQQNNKLKEANTSMQQDIETLKTQVKMLMNKAATPQKQAKSVNQLLPLYSQSW